MICKIVFSSEDDHILLQKFLETQPRSLFHLSIYLIKVVIKFIKLIKLTSKIYGEVSSVYLKQCKSKIEKRRQSC